MQRLSLEANMIRTLQRPYASIFGAPVIDRVDTDLFVKTYYMHCMQCDFCHDSCCAYGADIDVPNAERVMAHADALSAELGFPRTAWFKKTPTPDHEYPGGAYTRTRSVEGACVFLNRTGRGCLIHKFCLENGLDYHELKPLVCILFPISFNEGLFFPADEIKDGSLACLGPGPTLYRSSRDEVLHYFGSELVAELDAIEAECLSRTARGSVPLPLVG
jgi:Fe-S-cluster containining protein